MYKTKERDGIIKRVRERLTDGGSQLLSLLYRSLSMCFSEKYVGKIGDSPVIKQRALKGEVRWYRG